MYRKRRKSMFGDVITLVSCESMAWQCEIFSTPQETAIYFFKFTDPVISLRHSLTMDLIAAHWGLWIWFWRVWTHSPPHFLTLVEPLPSPSVSTCCGASVALSQDALFTVIVGTGSLNPVWHWFHGRYCTTLLTQNLEKYRLYIL